MHTRLLACTRRPEVLRALVHVYVPQRSFSQLTLLLNQSKDSGEGNKTSRSRGGGYWGRNSGRMDDASRLRQLEIQVWGLLGQQSLRRQEIKEQFQALRTEIADVRKLVKNPEATKTETTKKVNPPKDQSYDALKTEIEGVRKLAKEAASSKSLKTEIEGVRKLAKEAASSQSLKTEIEGIRKAVKGAGALAETLKNGLANMKEQNKEITERLGIIFKLSMLLQLQCKAALLKQIPKTLLGETPPSSTASIPDMLLSNRHRYSEVGLSSPEQMDWISAQWRNVFDEHNTDVESLSLYSIFTILKHLKKEERDVYTLVFQHCSGKRFVQWAKETTQEEKDKVLVP